MPKVSPAAASLPAAATAGLRRLGADLAIARKRRKQSKKAWAERLLVSVPTLSRMESGDPTVSVGVYATALWMIGRHEALGMLADPAADLAALLAEVRRATQRHRGTGKRDG